MKKRFFALLLAVALLLSLLPAATAANTREPSSDAPDSFEEAKTINTNQRYTDNISDDDDNDYFCFTLSAAGTLNLSFEHPVVFEQEEYWTAIIYDSSTNEICEFSFIGTDANTTSYMVGLPAGTFYLRIVGGSYSYGYSHRYSTEDYTFEVVYTQTDYVEKENNETFATATDIALNQSYTASINDEDDNDYYKFTLSKAGTVALKFDRKMLTDANEYWVAWLYNDQTEEICVYSFDGVSTSSTTYMVGLPAGTFYLRIVGGSYSYGYSHRYSTEDYTFEVVYTQTDYAEKENNETFATATDIALNQSYTASINDEDDNDYYKFTLSKAGTVALKFDRKMLTDANEYWVAWLYNDQTEEICAYSFDGANSSTDTYTIGLPVGTFFLRIVGGSYSYGYSHRYSTEDYTFEVVYTQTDYAEKENNETFTTATDIVLNQSYTASINDAYDKDYYKFSLEEDSELSIIFENPELASEDEYWVVNIFDNQNKKITSFSIYGSYSKTFTDPLAFSAGDYYLLITGGNYYYDYSHRHSAESYKVAVSDGTPHTHSYTDVTTPPTCTEQGYTTHTCACADSYVDSYVNALGHDYGNWTQTKAPTCTEKGKEKRTCSRCGASEIRDIAAKGHTEVTDAAVAPTCTKSGLSAGKHCSVCNAILVAQKTVAALGHEFKDGVCTVCGAADPNYKPSTPSISCDGGAGCPSRTFIDVSASSWYHLAVDFAVKNGLFGGMSSTTFEPDTAMTRAMLVTVLWRYEGKPTAPANRFSDVPTNAWYTDAVSWAASVGVVDGVGNNRFDPDGNITREQMAAILYRFSNIKGVGTSSRSSLSSFPDGSKTSSWAIEAVKWTVAEGIIGGSNGKLLPQGNATRAQVATILMRYINMISDNAGDNTSNEETKGHRYEFVIGKYSWLEAQDAARAKGGYLVNFNTQEEYFSVLSEIEVLGYQDVYFRIGGRRIGDSKEYYWVGADGATYGDCLNADNAWCLSLWQDGEPNYEWKSTREEFMEIFFSEDDNRWVWNDVGNQQTYPSDPTKTGFIIEYDTPYNAANDNKTIYYSDYYSLTLPEDWVGHCNVNSYSDGFSFEHTESVNAGYGGFLFSINLEEKASDYNYRPAFEFIGYMTIGAKKYHVVVYYPSDVQFGEPGTNIASQYMTMAQQIPSVLESITPLNGAIFERENSGFIR